jgi:hypothetical protein
MIQILRPISPGSSFTWDPCTPFPSGPNWGNVDEAVANDFTDYNYHLGVGNSGGSGDPYSLAKEDVFVLSPYASQAAIASVAVRMRIRRTTPSGGAKSGLVIDPYMFLWYSPAVNFGGGTNQWIDSYWIWTTNPATGLPWTPAQVAALKAGYYLGISNEFGTCTVYCTWFQVEVDRGDDTKEGDFVANADEIKSAVYRKLDADSVLADSNHLGGAGRIVALPFGPKVPPPRLHVEIPVLTPEPYTHMIRCQLQLRAVMPALSTDFDRARLGRILSRAVAVCTGTRAFTSPEYKFFDSWPGGGQSGILSDGSSPEEVYQVARLQVMVRRIPT